MDRIPSRAVQRRRLEVRIVVAEQSGIAQDVLVQLAQQCLSQSCRHRACAIVSRQQLRGLRAKPRPNVLGNRRRADHQFERKSRLDLLCREIRVARVVTFQQRPGGRGELIPQIGPQRTQGRVLFVPR